MQTTSSRRRHIVWLIIAAFIIAAGIFFYIMRDTGPEWRAALGYERAETFQFSLDQFGSPVIPIRIDSDTVDATFDTGNLVGLMVSTSVAEQLYLPVQSERDLMDASGAKVGTMRRFKVDSMLSCQRVWKNVIASEYTAGTLPALIGPRYFIQGRFTLDYPGRWMAVSRSETPDTSTAGVAVPMLTSPRFPGMILVAGNINGHPTLFEINTGSDRSCVDPEWAQLCRLKEVNDGYRIDEVEIGGLTFGVRSAKAIRFTAKEQGLTRAIKGSIGIDVLQDLRITVDYKQGRIYLFQPSSTIS